MRVSAKTDHALRAMVEIAAAPVDGPPVRAEDIAAAQGIPAPSCRRSSWLCATAGCRRTPRR